MRTFHFLFTFVVLFLFLGTTFAIFSVDDFIAWLQAKQATLSLAEKKTYYLQVYNNLTALAIRNHDDVEQAKLFVLLKDYVQTQIKNLWSWSSFSWVVASGMTIPNVDLAKVREVWLALHNEERTSKWLTPFAYSLDLERTASTWANHLATLRTVTHRRKSTDDYYSYASIKAWFINQWIVFSSQEVAGQSLFTENIWWNMYKCTKTDCTDDFIKAIKKSRTFFMSEKGKSYKPHYNAIVGNFSTIGLWVALVGNKYYLVSHYTQDLQ